MKRALHACLMTVLVLGLNSCTQCADDLPLGARVHRFIFGDPPPPGAPPCVPVPNNSFSVTGTVRRFNPHDHCMEGDINYYLHIGGDSFVRLAAHGDPNDTNALERAIKTGEMVYINGIRYPSPRSECFYLLVTRVILLGERPEKVRPRTQMNLPAK